MRILLLIFLLLSTTIVAQDSLSEESLLKTDTLRVTQPVLVDSLKPVKKPTKKTRKQKIVKQESETGDSISMTIIDAGATDGKSRSGGWGLFLLFFFVLIAGVAIWFLQRYFTRRYQEVLRNTEIYSDQQLRMILTRRDYYRVVYLKSEAWKRKRHVVLKRDNWTCVYCGSKATQVHHTRYAKWQIGKEPIEWLVSVCATCHEDIHR